jgi:hypothetical protein
VWLAIASARRTRTQLLDRSLIDVGRVQVGCMSAVDGIPFVQPHCLSLAASIGRVTSHAERLTSGREQP